MKDLDKMLSDMGKDSDIKEGGNMMTSEEKQRILTRTMEKIGKIEAESNIAATDGNIKVKFMSRRFTRAVAAALGVTLLVGGTAAATLKLNPAISSYFGINGGTQEKQATEMVSDAQATAKSGDVEVSMGQVMAYESGFYAVIDVKGLKKSSEKLFFNNYDFSVKNHKVDEGGISLGVCKNWFEGDTAKFLISVSYDDDWKKGESLSGKEVTFTLKDIGYYDYDNDCEFITICKGEWELKWKLEVNSKSIVKNINVPMNLNCSDVVWNKFELTPLSLTTYFKIEKYREFEGTKDEYERQVEGKDRLVVKYIDGRKIDSRFVGYGAEQDYHVLESNGYYKIDFKEIVDLDKVESVSFNGHEFILKENKNEPSYKRFTTNANFTLDVLSDTAKYLKTEEKDGAYNKDIGCRQDTVTFYGEKDGIKQELFTIYRLHTTDLTQIEDNVDVGMECVGFSDCKRGGCTYMIKYNEVKDKKAIETFSDIINNQLPYILAGFEYID